MLRTDILLHEEIDSLLQLQKINLKSNLTIEERASQGFLTFPYTAMEVKEMMRAMPQLVIKEVGSVQAYALACSKEVCSDHYLLKSMVDLSEGLRLGGKPLSEMRYYIMGQICVGSMLRGQGAFDALYEKHRSLFARDYACVVTEIAENNFRSMAAHKRVGFQVIHHYFDGETNWNLVLWDWK